jgi:hypothetical protein
MIIRVYYHINAHEVMKVKPQPLTNDADFDGKPPINFLHTEEANCPNTDIDAGP